MIKLAYSNDDQRGDLVRDGGNLELDAGLETAVTISLFTDRRAAEGDDVDPGIDPRGWWGDRYLRADGQQLGSRLWQLRRAKTTRVNVTRAAAWAREALRWLIDDRVAVTVEVTFERSAALGVYLLTVKITKPQKLAPRWERAWEVQLGL